MKIVTWNVNSLRARLPRVEDWIAHNQPDVLLMQETKCADEAFPASTFDDLGYATVHHGNGRWNGVAIASRVGLDAAEAGFRDRQADEEDRRIVSALCGGIRVYSVYVPNGRSVDSEHYLAKLEWLARLRAELSTHDPSDPLGIFGDFNVAPDDRDVWDISQFAGATHVTPAERDAVRALTDWGLTDAVRRTHPDGAGPFSWWDYRAGAFHKGWGMRIDLALLSAPVAARLLGAEIDRDARKGPQPSDHAPVVIELSD